MHISRKNKKTNVKLYYYDYPNIGDSLNVILLEKLFNMHVSYEDHINAEMIAIGSILDRLLSQGKISPKLLKMQENADLEHEIHVWGTGLMYPYEDIENQSFIRPVKIHALRGQLTADIVSQLPGSQQCQYALADPGLLVSKLLKNKVKKKYDIGLIPHYVDANEEVFVKMQKHYTNSVIIDVKAEPMSVLENIASCRTILSTSLHGLIIADSFNIPNRWCECSNRILGDGFKFRDYYSAFDLEMEPIDLKKDIFPEIEDIQSQYKISKKAVRKKQKALIECFPYLA